jgi:N-acetylglucosaminyl-diphospho-decaprenol L-rhamnosyltransferase
MTARAAPAAEQISVVFVSHSSGRTLSEAVRSVGHYLPGAEIVVVENGGADAADQFGHGIDQLTVAPNDGFGAGCNLGARLAKRPHLLFLNPDTRLTGVDPGGLAQAVERPRLGIFSPLLALDRSWRTEIPIYLARCLLKPAALTRFPLEGRIGHRPPWASGAAMLVRRSEFEAVCGFDERLFLYQEDRDLSRRFSAAGLPVAASRGVRVEHAGQSSSALATTDRIACSLTGLVELAEIWEGAARAAAARVLAFLSTMARVGVAGRKAREAEAIADAILRLLVQRPAHQYPAARAAFAAASGSAGRRA